MNIIEEEILKTTKAIKLNGKIVSKDTALNYAKAYKGHYYITNDKYFLSRICRSTARYHFNNTI